MKQVIRNPYFWQQFKLPLWKRALLRLSNWAYQAAMPGQVREFFIECDKMRKEDSAMWEMPLAELRARASKK